MIRSDRIEEQNAAFSEMMEATREPVTWAYDVWSDVVCMLGHRSNRVRAIAAQLLCNLARHSDPHARIMDDLDALVAVTRDERFVTARHCMQSLWKAGVAGERQRARLIRLLKDRFRECETEKNGTLIRFDIIQAFRCIWEESGDPAVAAAAAALIETEKDAGYRKKYARLWPTPKSRPT